MNAQELLQEISDYCRQTGLAESTFGRRAVNDGKLASRLRHGGRITTETLDRIRNFMSNNANVVTRPAVIPRTIDRSPETTGPALAAPPSAATVPVARPAPMLAASMPMSVPRGAPMPSPGGLSQGGAGGPDPQRNFRFFDNRQKYL